MSRWTSPLTLLLLVGLASCHQTEARPSSSASASTTPPPVSQAAYVDSVVSRAEALRSFRADLRERPAALDGDYASREALVRRFVHVVEQDDTLGLVALVITRAEFAYLYYPSNPASRPPYDLAPGLMWFQLQESNRKSVLALLRERGGAPLDYVGHDCSRSQRQGVNTIWSECELLRRAPGGETRRERLFGTIIERQGRYKFVGLGNEL